ncbi:hypothetical protein [Maribacter sp. 2307ULW6-5]|uniref:hypothetical protein n=1 Tax=Maribacter sp. 2307ULW6-5 TaxID=3386275 RepID=UPI0039BC6EAE
MKSVVILFVAMTMLARPLWPIAEYIANYDYIVNVLCENKDRPELECNGKCYLSKMLAEATDREQQNPFQEHRGTAEVLLVFLEAAPDHDLAGPALFGKEDNFKTPSKCMQGPYPADIAHPPQLG